MSRFLYRLGGVAAAHPWRTISFLLSRVREHWLATGDARGAW